MFPAPDLSCTRDKVTQWILSIKIQIPLIGSSSSKLNRQEGKATLSKLTKQEVFKWRNRRFGLIKAIKNPVNSISGKCCWGWSKIVWIFHKWSSDPFLLSEGKHHLAFFLSGFFCVQNFRAAVCFSFSGPTALNHFRPRRICSWTQFGPKWLVFDSMQNDLN